MYSKRANETKPQRNRSKIVDLQKRNLNSELTVTIPENEKFSRALHDEEGDNPTYQYDVHTESVIAQLAENSLMSHFKRCFDQFKLMNSHLCIDVSKPPFVQVAVKQMVWHPQYIQWSIGNTGTWYTYNPQGYDPANPIPGADIVYNANNRESFEAIFPPQSAIITSDVADGVGFVVEVPFTVAAASRRAIPDGYFSWNNANNYVEPTWEQLMSYGSVIWESKLPGAPVHLSLDIEGSSNSERMMTFPTDMLNKLHTLHPMNQQGRFCPFIMYGMKTRILSNAECANAIVSQLNAGLGGYADNDHSAVVDTQLKYFNGWQYKDFSFNIGANPVIVHFRARGYFDFDLSGVPPVQGAGGMEEDPSFEADYLVVGTENPTYSLSIMGYHTCRMKQLRTVLSYDNIQYNQFILNFMSTANGWHGNIRTGFTGLELSRTFAVYGLDRAGLADLEGKPENLAADKDRIIGFIGMKVGVRMEVDVYSLIKDGAYVLDENSTTANFIEYLDDVVETYDRAYIIYYYGPKPIRILGGFSFDRNLGPDDNTFWTFYPNEQYKQIADADDEDEIIGDIKVQRSVYFNTAIVV